MPPAPKRSTERRRRNLEGRPEKASPSSRVRGPRLPKDHHLEDLAVEWYEALRRSGQAVYFQPSDWLQARICAEALSTWLRNRHSTSLQVALSGMAGLMVTEGERRRLRLELETSSGPKADPAKAAAAAYGAGLQAVS